MPFILQPGAKLDFSTDADMMRVLRCSAAELQEYESAMREYVRYAPDSVTVEQAWSAIELTSDYFYDLVRGVHLKSLTPLDFHSCVFDLQDFLWKRGLEARWQSLKSSVQKRNKRNRDEAGLDDADREPQKGGLTAVAYFNEYMVRAGKKKMKASARVGYFQARAARCESSREHAKRNATATTKASIAVSGPSGKAVNVPSTTRKSLSLPSTSTSISYSNDFDHVARKLQAAAEAQVQNAVDHKTAVNGYAKDMDAHIQRQVAEQVAEERVRYESNISALKYREREVTSEQDILKQRESQFEQRKSDFAKDKLQWEKNFADEKVEWEAGMRKRIRAEMLEEMSRALTQLK